MYLYNVTINIDPSVHDEWLQWMKTVHIPEVMNTGCFVDQRMLKVLHVEDEGFTYSIQYTFIEMSHMEEYKLKYAPLLQKKTNDAFRDKFVAFRTILEIL